MVCDLGRISAPILMRHCVMIGWVRCAAVNCTSMVRWARSLYNSKLMTEQRPPDQEPLPPRVPEPRTIGRYALLSATQGAEYIRTPLGEMPLAELSALFHTQIAPLDYYPPQEPAGHDAIEVAIIDNNTLEVNGRQVRIEEESLFPWNVLMALRGTDGATFTDGIAFGLLHDDVASAGTPEDIWHSGANELMESLNDTVGMELIGTTAIPGCKDVRYCVDPRLHLVDMRPTDERSVDYFEQTLGGRLVALEEDQTLFVPYRQDPLRFALTTNWQVERDGEAWILDEDERYLLSLIRLANGKPLLAPELLEMGFLGNGVAPPRRFIGRLQSVIGSLNRSIFNDGSGLNVLVLDKTTPRLLRLARSIVITDERQLRTPNNPIGDDIHLRHQVADALRRYRRTHRDMFASYHYPPIKAVHQPRTEHLVVGRARALDAFLQNKIGLRDIYLICLRAGLWLPELENVELPLADGRRLPYAKFEANLRRGNTTPLSIVAKELGIGHSFAKDVFNDLMRKLNQ
jgi:hypothetical protein